MNFRFFLLAVALSTSIRSSIGQRIQNHQEQTEDWAVLSAKQSGLDISSVTGVVFEKADFPEFSREVVRVQWRSGDPIDLYVIRPHGVAKPPVILYLYDYLTDTDRFRSEIWSREAVKHGFAAVGFVSAFSGHRYHSRPMREWFVSELQESLATSTHDVQMILNYLAARADVDTTKIGMLGEGSGGTIAILAAATDERIAFVDVINPWGDWPEWMRESLVIPEEERSTYSRSEFIQKVATFDPVVYLPQFRPGKLRIEEVAGDPMTPKSVQTKIVASAPSASDVVQYPDARTLIHRWTEQKWWLKAQLENALAQSNSSATQMHPLAVTPKQPYAALQ